MLCISMFVTPSCKVVVHQPIQRSTLTPFLEHFGGKCCLIKIYYVLMKAMLYHKCVNITNLMELWEVYIN
jgi:hypothetical protein